MLHLIARPEAGTAPQSILLPSKSGAEVILGRGAKGVSVDAIVALRDGDKELISRRHLRIVAFKSDENTLLYRAEDMGAVNGVFVERQGTGKRLKIKTHHLVNGDVIQIGGMAGLEEGAELPQDSDISIVYEFQSTVSEEGGGGGPGAGGGAPSHTGTVNSRKRSLIGTDSMQHLKKASPPISLSNGDQSSALQKQNAFYQEQLMKQQLDIKSSEVDALKIQLSKLQDNHDKMVSENVQLAVSLTNKEEKIKSLKSQLKQMEKAVQQRSAFVENGINDASHAQVDVASLRTSLNCAICSFTMMDAVVMRCSHGFCRSCLEIHLAVRPMRCLCPICNDAPPKKTSLAARPLLYVRSSHLDQLIWMLVEASSRTDKQAFKEREKKNRDTLISLGIDPDANFFAGANQNDEGEGKSKKKKGKKGSCEYCGGQHTGPCPHDDGAESGGSSSEDEDSHLHEDSQDC